MDKVLSFKYLESVLPLKLLQNIQTLMDAKFQHTYEIPKENILTMGLLENIVSNNNKVRRGEKCHWVMLHSRALSF